MAGKRTRTAREKKLEQAGERAVEMICRLMEDEDAKDADRLKAAQVLMDRAWDAAQAEQKDRGDAQKRVTFEMADAVEEYAG